MTADAPQQRRSPPRHEQDAGRGLATLAGAGKRVLEAERLDDALGALVEPLAHATESEVVVVRTIDDATDSLVARAVFADSSSRAAELEGSRLPASALGEDEIDALELLSAPVRRSVERVGAGAALQVPVVVAGRALASLELMRSGDAYDERERALARLAADYVALAVRAFRLGDGDRRERSERLLEVAGDALVAGADEERTADQVASLAADASDASGCVLWSFGDQGHATVLAVHGIPADAPELPAAAEAAVRALSDPRPIVLEAARNGLPGGARRSLTLRLGEPPLGALQLFFPADSSPSELVLRRIATFGVRAAHALRASQRARGIETELERSRALLAVVGQAIAQLSLAHTLETAIQRVAELLGSDRLAVYLLEEDGERLLPAAGRGLSGPHVRVAERLLELALGPFRGRGILVVDDARKDRRLASVRAAASRAGIESAVAVPLLVHEEVIGLLAVYTPRSRTVTPNEAALVSALASQLAVAVQNARLHERAKRAESEARDALASEQRAARELGSLYEISRAFAQSLSLDTTLKAVARTVVELVDADAAVVRMPDARGEELVAVARYTADPSLREPVDSVLARPQALEKLPGRRLFRMGKPLTLDAETATRLGASYELLTPFFEKGSTAAVLPISTQAELLGTLTVVALDPDRPLTTEKVDLALAIAGQAALAIDNARLYQQQKRLLDAMQRSLLPRSYPRIKGLELGDVYASSARVDVGGDVYDFMTLADGRLAVVLGDVTGKGIEAAADMAMAKFVFRSLAREHPDPGDFLSSANEVAVEELAQGKFITMLYLTVDPARGELVCASAGHPAPRLVLPDGQVSALPVRGLALGVQSGQRYDELRERLPSGASVVLYTDGVPETRRGGELYGEERLDSLLAARVGAPPGELAHAILDDCRAFGGGELDDDCAVVVIRRTD